MQLADVNERHHATQLSAQKHQVEAEGLRTQLDEERTSRYMWEQRSGDIERQLLAEREQRAEVEVNLRQYAYAAQQQEVSALIPRHFSVFLSNPQRRLRR